MRLHIASLPHTPFSDQRASSCAFTAKTVRLARMLKANHEVHVYHGGADNAEPGIEYHPMLSSAEQLGLFGEWVPSKLPSISWDPNSPGWSLFNQRCIESIAKNIQPGDIVAVVGGGVQQSVVDAFVGGWVVIEPGVGYEGICTNTFRCFESHTWRHNRYGAMGISNGAAFDTVIPNAVDPNDFSIGADRDYALFLGRVIVRKGTHVAVDVANAAGMKIVIAGAGATSVYDWNRRERVFYTGDGPEYRVELPVRPGQYEMIPYVDVYARRYLLSGASVLIMPTLYIEPWGGVHAEALMSGVPVVAPNYGVFVETVDERFRYDTFQEAVRAVEYAKRCRQSRSFQEELRERAIERFSLTACAARYERWLAKLAHVRSVNGWYA